MDDCRHMGGLSKDVNKGGMLASTQAVKRWKGKRFEADLGRAKTWRRRSATEISNAKTYHVIAWMNALTFFSLLNCATLLCKTLCGSAKLTVAPAIFCLNHRQRHAENRIALHKHKITFK